MFMKFWKRISTLIRIRENQWVNWLENTPQSLFLSLVSRKRDLKKNLLQQIPLKSTRRDVLFVLTASYIQIMSISNTITRLTHRVSKKLRNLVSFSTNIQKVYRKTFYLPQTNKNNKNRHIGLQNIRRKLLQKSSVYVWIFFPWDV